ncbi:MAG: DUF502 domain-containing protein [Flavobacteriales bacterium]|nr:DUF502 domain-containing protein [Flavobacteriales bacterium]
MLRKKFTSILSYFLRGLVFIAPIIITYGIIKWVFETLDGILPLGTPGLGILVMLVVITIFGYFGSKLFYQPLFEWFENLLERTPGVKFIYTSIKDMLEAFVGDKKRFKEPVLVKMNDSGILKIGFITSKDLSNLNRPDILEDYYGVYFPHSYNFSGNHFLVKKDQIIPFEANSSEVMKYVVSGGITELS